MVAACPILWGLLDMALYQWLYRRKDFFPYYVIQSFGFFLGVGPIVVSAISLLAWKCQRSMGVRLDIAVNLLLVLLMFLKFAAAVVLSDFIDDLIWRDLKAKPWLAAAFWSGIMIFLGFFCWQKPCCSHW